MKKWIKSLLAFNMMFMLSACSSGPQPEATLESYLQSVQSAESIDASTLYNEEYFDMSLPFYLDLSAMAPSNITDDAFTLKILGLVQDFDYTIGDVETNGNEATIELTITSYSLGEIMSAWMTKWMTFGIEYTTSGEEMSDDEMNQKYVELLDEAINETSKSNVNTFDVYMTDDGGWKINANDNDDLITALLGGLY